MIQTIEDVDNLIPNLRSLIIRKYKKMIDDDQIFIKFLIHNRTDESIIYDDVENKLLNSLDLIVYLQSLLNVKLNFSLEFINQWNNFIKIDLHPYLTSIIYQYIDKFSREIYNKPYHQVNKDNKIEQRIINIYELNDYNDKKDDIWNVTGINPSSRQQAIIDYDHKLYYGSYHEDILNNLENKQNNFDENKILGYIEKYDKIAIILMASNKSIFNNISSDLIKNGFNKVYTYTFNFPDKVKNYIPNTAEIIRIGSV